MLRRTLLAAAATGLCHHALAAKISIPDSAVSFQAPEGFTELTQSEIRAKWLRGSPPSFAIGNSRRSTTIAYSIKNHNVPESGLEEGLRSFEQVFDRLIPGIDWKKKEITVINGKRWIYLEMTSSAIDTDIHNILLCAPHEGRFVMLNFNSTKEEFPRLEAVLRKSIATITLGK